MANKAFVICYLCLFLVLGSYCSALEIFLPWGKRAGAVSQRLTSPTEREKYTGPTSVRVGPNGDLYVLDTLGAKVERYKTDGSHVASYPYPEASQYDEELIGIDFAFSPKGAIYILEEGLQSILVMDEKGKFLGVRPLPNLGDNPPFLSGIECDDLDRIYVFNGYDNSVYRFSLDKEGVARSLCEIAMQKVLLGSGTFLGLVDGDVDSFSHFDIVQTDPFTAEAKRKKLFTIKTKKALCDVVVLGQDKEGKVYVEAAEGAVERPSARRVYVFKDGKAVKRFVVPPKPRRLSSFRTRVLTPGGKLFCVRVKATGFVLQSFP